MKEDTDGAKQSFDIESITSLCEDLQAVLPKLKLLLSNIPNIQSIDEKHKQLLNKGVQNIINGANMVFHAEELITYPY